MFSYGAENEIKAWIQAPSPDVDVKELTERWREAIGDVGAVENFYMNYTLNDIGSPITLVLASTSLDDLRAVSAELRASAEGLSGCL